jgi:hypothetical protein
MPVSAMTSCGSNLLTRPVLTSKWSASTFKTMSACAVGSPHERIIAVSSGDSREATASAWMVCMLVFEMIFIYT